VDLKARAQTGQHPTLLEALFWGWLGGFIPASQYPEELMITTLAGPGYLPDDFQGAP
jgi:hypothetical protein